MIRLPMPSPGHEKASGRGVHGLEHHMINGRSHGETRRTRSETLRALRFRGPRPGRPRCGHERALMAGDMFMGGGGGSCVDGT